VTDPPLLLEKPLSALDPTSRAQTRADLGARLRTFDANTILVTHDPLQVPSAVAVCGTIAHSAVALYRMRPLGSPRNTWPVTVEDILLIGQTARPCRPGHDRGRRRAPPRGRQQLWAAVKPPGWMSIPGDDRWCGWPSRP